MEISADSRYANNPVIMVTGWDGVTRQTILPRPPISRTLTVTDYVWSEGDRVDLVAARAFGDDTMWWVIAQANPEILDWTHLEPGTVVRIPGALA